MTLDRIKFETARKRPLPPDDKQPIAVIQARTGSSRLPRKVMMNLGDRPVLVHVINRLAHSAGLSRILVATTDLAEDDTVANLASVEGTGVFRGDANDVLNRYLEAVVAEGASSVVRITGDCPLIDPTIVDAVIGAWWNDGNPYEYAGNTLERTFPDGMDVEVFTRSTLGRLAELAEGSDREHVTSLLVKDPSPYKCINVEYEHFYADVRLTLDTEDDLAKLRWIEREASKRNPDFGLSDLLVVEGYPT